MNAEPAPSLRLRVAGERRRPDDAKWNRTGSAGRQLQGHLEDRPHMGTDLVQSRYSERHVVFTVGSRPSTVDRSIGPRTAFPAMARTSCPLIDTSMVAASMIAEMSGRASGWLPKWWDSPAPRSRSRTPVGSRCRSSTGVAVRCVKLPANTTVAQRAKPRPTPIRRVRCPRGPTQHHVHAPGRWRTPITALSGTPVAASFCHDGKTSGSPLRPARRPHVPATHARSARSPRSRTTSTVPPALREGEPPQPAGVQGSCDPVDQRIEPFAGRQAVPIAVDPPARPSRSSPPGCVAWKIGTRPITVPTPDRLDHRRRLGQPWRMRLSSSPSTASTPFPAAPESGRPARRIASPAPFVGW